jgi:general secretion pathway protein G
MVRITVSGNAAGIVSWPQRLRGFTLIELLVVMSIIATLLMIAVPRYFHSLERSKEVVLRQDLAVMRDAIDKFYGDLARYPESLVELVELRYLRSVPTDPETKSKDTWVLIQSDDAQAPGARDVRSGAQGAASDGTEFETW